MSEDPKTPEIPETPGDEPGSGGKPVSPNEPIFDSEMDYSAETSQPAETKPEGREDEIYDLRQALLNEANRSRRGTGRLLRTLRRATGSLRRVTGGIKKDSETDSTGPLTTEPLTTEPLSPEPAAAEQTPSELPPNELPGTEPSADLPLTTGQPDGGSLEEGSGPEQRPGRETSFEGEAESAASMQAANWSVPERWEDIEVPEEKTDDEASDDEAPDLDSLLSDDSPLSMLESGAIAALGEAEEEAKQSSELDWMRELREEAAEEEQDGKEEAGGPAGPTSPRAATGQLRDFINSLLGRPPTRPLDKSKAGEETGLPDDLVKGRLGQLGAEDQPPAQIISGAEAWPGAMPGAAEGEAGEPEDTFGPSFVSGPTTGESETLEAGAEEEQASYLDGLELNFGTVGEFGTGEAGTLDLYPEDEALLWGNTGQLPNLEQQAPQEGEPLNFEDLWSEREPPTSVFGADLRREIWGEMEEAEPSKLNTGPLTSPAESSDQLLDELYADLYQTETEYPVEAEETEPAGEDQEEVSQAAGTTGEIDLRAVALQGYEEEGDLYAAGTYTINWAAVEGTDEAEAAKTAVTVETPEAAAAVEEEKAKAKKAGEGWKAWLEKNKVLQKALLVEAVLAAVAMLIAVPFFVFMIVRGPAKPATQVLAVSSLPSNLPYPTGLTLPGGWYFPLEKSTIADGQWQPVTSEWLEGTELRRVLALPWSPQTEAVVKSFKPGDAVELTLSNNDTLKYRFSNIQRVAVSDTKIYTEQRSSLVIILYQEKAKERWVVVCTP